MQKDQHFFFQEVESIAAEHLSFITEKYSKEEYMNYAETYLQPQFKIICEKAKSSGLINVDFTNSGIHYKRPGGVPQLQILSDDEKIRLDIWKKLVQLTEDQNLHFAKVLQSYNEKKEIHILIEDDKKEGCIHIPYDIAEKLHKWITEELINFPENEKDKIHQSFLGLLENLGRKNIETIRIQLQTAINDNDRFSNVETTLKSLLLSLHLTLYRLKSNKPYHCFYSKISDGKYNLGSFAGCFEEDITDKLRDIQNFSKGLLSYITYWEGIADYEKDANKTILRDKINCKIKDRIKVWFDDYFRELLFFDPEDKIRGSLYFDDVFKSKRRSHQTGKLQKILVVRLRVESKAAFKFLYCDGATNYSRIENYLENIITDKWKTYNRVRLDVAIADTIPRLNTLYTKTTQPLKLEKAVLQGKIKSKGIIYKFYKKYQDLLHE